MYLLTTFEHASDTLCDLLRREPETRALPGLGIVLDELVADADPLDRDLQSPIRDALYDRRPEAACERVFL